MEKHHRSSLIGLVLVLILLFVMSFGTLTFTGFVSAPLTAQKPDLSTPIFFTLLVGSIGIVYYVYKTRN
ncbi:MAG: hypothetical protein AABX51_04585 [Nanoarchaeota archaeon]